MTAVVENHRTRTLARRRWMLVRPVQHTAPELMSDRPAWDLVAVEPHTGRAMPRRKATAPRIRRRRR
jgi:hypothetical protein